VVPAAQGVVRTVDEGDLHADGVGGAGRHFRDEAPEVLCRGVVPATHDADFAVRGRGRGVGVEDAGAEETDRVRVDGREGLVLARASNVVVPVAFHVYGGAGEGLRQAAGAEETLFFAGRRVVVATRGVVGVVHDVDAAAVVVARDDIGAVGVRGAVDLRDDVGNVDWEGDARRDTLDIAV